MQILIAEDDVASRLMLSAVLKKWGFETIEASDGAAAWRLLEQPRTPRLLVLDWNMPEINGLELCRRIRAIETSDPPYIILLTARSDMQDIVKGLDAGANDYVVKPYDNEELRARLGVGRRMLELQAELNRTRNALAHEASHDALTHLLNRKAILDVLNLELQRAKRTKKALCLGILDIDHFKTINDQFGHQVGDDVLVGFSDRLMANMRDYDSLGRYGGEEFIVIAPDGDAAMNIQGPFERLRKEIAKAPFSTRAGGIQVTVSIGVTSSDGSHSMDQALAAADSALYQVKQGGRNQVAFQPIPEQ